MSQQAFCTWVSPGWVCGLDAGHKRKHQAVADWTLPHLPTHNDKDTV